MKKFYLLILSIVCLSAMSVYAESPCDGEMGMKQNSMYGSQYSNQYQKPNCGCKKHTYKQIRVLSLVQNHVQNPATHCRQSLNILAQLLAADFYALAEKLILYFNV